MLALFAVAARLLWPSAATDTARSLRGLVPGWAEEPAIASDEDEPGARSHGRPLSPLYYDGPRELQPVAHHEPSELRIPALNVRTRLLKLDKRADGRMQVPGDFALAGWYVRGPAPGQVGPAVIAGHLDSRRGPAVFARLGELEPGAAILVERGDGHVVRFTVRKVASYAKDAFPTHEVYGDTAAPELRLITCDGDFDRRRRSYEHNLVVYAQVDRSSLPPDPGPRAPRETPSGDPGSETSPPPSPSSGPGGGTPTPTTGPAPSDSPAPRPSRRTPSPSPSGLPTEEPTSSPSPSGGLPIP